MVEDSETIIRLARIPENRHPLAIYSGVFSVPILARMVAISLCRVPRSRDPGYVLYFLNSAGQDLETIQTDSLRSALDEAHTHTGLVDGDWTTCRIEVLSDDREFDLDALAAHLPDP